MFCELESLSNPGKYSDGTFSNIYAQSRGPLTALRGHLMNLLGPFLALKKKKCWFSKLKSILKIKKNILDYYSERIFLKFHHLVSQIE